jgi:hypothetical protein
LSRTKKYAPRPITVFLFLVWPFRFGGRVEFLLFREAVAPVDLLPSGIGLARSIFGEIDSGEIDLGRRTLVFRGDSEPDFANIRRPLGTIP